MCASHESEPDTTPDRIAVLYGMRTALGMVIKFTLPCTKTDWDLLLMDICGSFRGRNSYYFPTVPKRNTPFGAMDFTLVREVCKKIINDYEIPPKDLAVLAGMRIGCAWALELPKGGWPLANLMAGNSLTPTMPLLINVNTFGVACNGDG